MTLAEIFDVLTCSTVACPHDPLWFEVPESWAAHFGLAVLLERFTPKRFVLASVALLICKELTYDIPRDPPLATLGDSAGDTLAMWFAPWAVRGSQFARAALFNRFARLWPLK